MRKQLLAAVLAAVLMLSLFAGCTKVETGGTEDEEVITTFTSNPSRTSTTSKAPASSRKASTTSRRTTASTARRSTVTQTDAASDVFVPNLTVRAIMPSGWASNYLVASVGSDATSTPPDKPPEIGTAVPADVVGAETLATQARSVLDFMLGITGHDGSDNKSERNLVWKADNAKMNDVFISNGSLNPDGTATLWPYGAFLEATGAACQYEPEAYEREYTKALSNLRYYEIPQDIVNQRHPVSSQASALSEGYLSLSCFPNNGANEVYYDDDVWVAKEYIHAYQLLGDQQYLTRAERLARYIYDTGWNEEANFRQGGILWMDDAFRGSGSPRRQKNSCINCPAVDLFTELYTIGKDSYYLDAATKTYGWVKSNLMAVDRDGDYTYIMNDKYYFNDANVLTLDGGQLTYNTGEMLSAAVGVYLATQDEDYLSDAKNIAEAAANKWMNRTVYKGNWTVLWRGTAQPWFNSYLVEGFINLYNVDPANNEYSKYMKMVRSSLYNITSRNYDNGEQWIPNDWASGAALANTNDDKNLMNQSASVRVTFMTSAWIKAFEGSTEDGIAPLSPVACFKNGEVQPS